MARRGATTPVVENAPIEILEEEGGPGLGIDFGIILGTTLLLLGAVFLVMLAVKDQYDRGMLS